MADLISTAEAAALWNLSPRRVAILCKEGRIPGAVLEGRRWLIPADAQKPSDHRLKTAESVKTPKSKLLPLPVGISDFKRASTQYYYVDKTLLIRDFLDELPIVSLFTRPRRFGKTLNMDMLRTFSRRQMRIPPYTSAIRTSGNAGSDTAIIRANILSSISPSRTQSSPTGQTRWRASVFCSPTSSSGTGSWPTAPNAPAAIRSTIGRS